MNKCRIKFVDFSSDSVPSKIRHALDLAGIEYELSDNPDYIFCSVFGHEALNYNCVRIFWTGENCVPDFNLYDYAIGFHYLDFGDRYIRMPLFYFYSEDYSKALNKHKLDVEKVWKRTGICNFVYSNADAAMERQKFFDLISKKVSVDSGGRYLNNVGGPVENKFEFQSRYRFSIAFENSSAPGYTTEKILQAFAAGTIPIYWGDPRIANHFNEKSFINCHAYQSFEQVIEEVERVNNDKSLFGQYINEPIWNDNSTDEFPDDPMKLLVPFFLKVFLLNKDNCLVRNTGSWGRKYEIEQSNLYLKTACSDKHNFIKSMKNWIK